MKAKKRKARKLERDFYQRVVNTLVRSPHLLKVVGDRTFYEMTLKVAWLDNEIKKEIGEGQV